MNPYCFKLVGQAFRLGDNPRVDAQFSAQYCVANAIVRRSSTLRHFQVEQIVDPAVQRLVERVTVESHAAADPRGHTAVDLVLHTSDGAVHRRALDIAPGFPGDELSDAQQRDRFDACMACAPRPLPPAQCEQFLASVDHLSELADARRLAGLLVVPHS